jgi:hypothetical protein
MGKTFEFNDPVVLPRRKQTGKEKSGEGGRGRGIVFLAENATTFLFTCFS